MNQFYSNNTKSNIRIYSHKYLLSYWLFNRLWFLLISNASIVCVSACNILFSERCPAETVTTKKGTFTWPEVEFNTTVQLECPYGKSTRGQEIKTQKKSINKDTSDVRGKIHQRLSRVGEPFAERSCLLVNGSLTWTSVSDAACEDEVSNMVMVLGDWSK